jgi:hypothetical protein
MSCVFVQEWEKRSVADFMMPFIKSFSSGRETRAAADANYEENAAQEVSEAKGAPCNTASIKLGTKELVEKGQMRANQMPPLYRNFKLRHTLYTARPF